MQSWVSSLGVEKINYKIRFGNKKGMKIEERQISLYFYLVFRDSVTEAGLFLDYPGIVFLYF